MSSEDIQKDFKDSTAAEAEVIKVIIILFNFYAWINFLIFNQLIIQLNLG